MWVCVLSTATHFTLYCLQLNELVERLKVTIQNSAIARQEIAASSTNIEFATLIEVSLIYWNILEFTAKITSSCSLETR